jgi:hypothetical protein
LQNSKAQLVEISAGVLLFFVVVASICIVKLLAFNFYLPLIVLAIPKPIPRLNPWNVAIFFFSFELCLVSMCLRTEPGI